MLLVYLSGRGSAAYTEIQEEGFGTRRRAENSGSYSSRKESNSSRLFRASLIIIVNNNNYYYVFLAYFPHGTFRGTPSENYDVW